MLNFKQAENLLKLFTKLNYHMKEMSKFQGKIEINSSELDLDLTLLGGQSFRWEKLESNGKGKLWKGVACNAYWELTQTPDSVSYKVYVDPSNSKRQKRSADFYGDLLKRYLRLDFDLNENVTKWRKSHKHFDELAPRMKAVRVLDQEPLENILSFICSQNNNIKRISSMIQWLCCNYGNKIGNFHTKDEYSFPSLESLVKAQNELESRLRAAKFGYRAKFIAGSVAKINEFGGSLWFDKLRTLPYAEARTELVQLSGIGFKVADCICLMSLNHLESVPIDTHIFKIAQNVYMPQLRGVKAVTPKVYEEIAEKFREIYGSYAGWTQAVLFCSELQQFQTEAKDENPTHKPKKKRSK